MSSIRDEDEDEDERAASGGSATVESIGSRESLDCLVFSTRSGDSTPYESLPRSFTVPEAMNTGSLESSSSFRFEELASLACLQGDEWKAARCAWTGSCSRSGRRHVAQCTRLGRLTCPASLVSGLMGRTVGRG